MCQFVVNEKVRIAGSGDDTVYVIESVHEAATGCTYDLIPEGATPDQCGTGMSCPRDVPESNLVPVS